MSHPRTSDAYDDDYGTCVETYATLCVYSDVVAPSVVTDRLEVSPTRSFSGGEAFGTLKHLRRKTNGWFLSTQGESQSRDSRRHLDMILEALEGKTAEVHSLQTEGCEFVITSYWVSVGHGGPSLWPRQMSRLGELNIETWWDVYFQGEDET